MRMNFLNNLVVALALEMQPKHRYRFLPEAH